MAGKDCDPDKKCDGTGYAKLIHYIISDWVDSGRISPPPTPRPAPWTPQEISTFGGLIAWILFLVSLGLTFLVYRIFS